MQVEPQLRDRIVTALEGCSPSFGHKPLIEDAVSKLAGVLDENSARDIISFLVSLYWVRADHSLSASTLAKDVKQDALESGDSNLQEPLGGWDGFEGFLVKLLSLDGSLGLSAKALFIAYQAPRHFHKGRIITDARPVFTPTAAQGPAMFVVLHTLQVDFHENGEDHEWFISMDTSDLENLRDAITRALEKEGSLSEALTKTGIPVGTWQET